MATQPSYNERELLQLIANGDEPAFRVFFHQYAPKIEFIIHRVIKTNMLTKDILQEVFFRVWMKRDQLPAIIETERWLISIAYHQCFYRLREIKRREAREQAYENDNTAAHTNEAETNLTIKELQQQINTAVEKMTPQLKRVYDLSRNKHLTIQEISRQLNISPQTVKNTLSRALQQIREHLEKQGILLPLILLSIHLK